MIKNNSDDLLTKINNKTDAITPEFVLNSILYLKKEYNLKKLGYKLKQFILSYDIKNDCFKIIYNESPEFVFHIIMEVKIDYIKKNTPLDDEYLLKLTDRFYRSVLGKISKYNNYILNNNTDKIAEQVLKNNLTIDFLNEESLKYIINNNYEATGFIRRPANLSLIFRNDDLNDYLYELSFNCLKKADTQSDLFRECINFIKNNLSEKETGKDYVGLMYSELTKSLSKLSDRKLVAGLESLNLPDSQIVENIFNSSDNSRKLILLSNATKLKLNLTKLNTDKLFINNSICVSNIDINRLVYFDLEITEYVPHLASWVFNGCSGCSNVSISQSFYDELNKIKIKEIEDINEKLVNVKNLIK